MRLLSVVAVLLSGALAGCAQTPVASSANAPEVGGNVNQGARIHTELAALYYTRGQHAVALGELRTALADDSRYAPAYNMLGLVHTELHEFAEAEANFRRAIELAPSYSEGHNNFGYFLCQRGRHDEGLTQYEAALKNPLYVSPEIALANAASCSMAKGDLARAEGYLQRAFARAPNQPIALRAAAELDFRRGQLQEARSALMKLAESTELDAAALWLGVRIERKLDNQAAEASFGAQLRRRFPDAPQTKLLMNGIYEGSGQ